MMRSAPVTRPAHALLALAILATVAVFSGGCVTVGPPEAQPIHTFVLSPAPIPNRSTAPCGDVLVVSTPTAHAGYDSARMMYSERESELHYFVFNRWADRPTTMLEPILVQAVESTGRFHAVVGIANGILPELRLDTRIVSLHQEFITDNSQVRVALRVQLVDLMDRRVLATALFEEVEFARTDDPYGGVTALNRALTRMMGRVADFVSGVQIPRHYRIDDPPDRSPPPS